MKRERATPKQSLLDNAGRQSNVAGAFRVARPAEVAGQRILLLDDVLTTGATLNACAAALKKAGATHVSALTLARVDHRVPATFESAVPAPSGSPNAGATA
jgi:predicted amidophosphoribosyltransferase